MREKSEENAHLVVKMRKTAKTSIVSCGFAR